MHSSEHPSSQELIIPDKVSLKALTDLRAERLAAPVIEDLSATIENILQVPHPVLVVREPFSPFLEFRMQGEDGVLGTLKVQEIHSTSETGEAVTRYQTMYSYFATQHATLKLREHLLMQAGYYIRKEMGTPLWSDVYKLTEAEESTWEYLAEKGLARRSKLHNAAGQAMYFFVG